MSGDVIVFDDGYIYLNVTEKAKEIYNSGLFELYEVRVEEQTEALLTHWNDLTDALEGGDPICISVDKVKVSAVEN